MARTKFSRVLAELKEGPATCSEIAATSGISLKHCAAYLLKAHQRGLVTRVVAPGLRADRKAFGKGRAPFLYTLVALGTVATPTTQPKRTSHVSDP